MFHTAALIRILADSRLADLRRPVRRTRPTAR